MIHIWFKKGKGEGKGREGEGREGKGREATSLPTRVLCGYTLLGLVRGANIQGKRGSREKYGA